MMTVIITHVDAHHHHHHQDVSVNTTTTAIPPFHSMARNQHQVIRVSMIMILMIWPQCLSVCSGRHETIYYRMNIAQKENKTEME